MGKKAQSPAERARIRKAAAERRQAKEVRQMTALIISLLVITAVIVLVVVVKNAITLPAKIANLDAIQDNWIVIDADASTGTRYHQPATFVTPEGYVQSETTTFEDDILQSIQVTAESEDAVVSGVNVFGGVGWTAEEFIQRAAELSPSALNEGVTVTVGEPFAATIAGKDGHCVYLHYTDSTAEGAQDYGCLYVAFDTSSDIFVYAVLSGAYTTLENVQTTETLLAEAETLLAGLTLHK